MKATKQLIVLLLQLCLFFVTGCEKPPETVKSDVVLNELLPVNSTVAADQDGEYDDWIELYNMSGSAVDLSGYYLSDSKDHFSKWQFPAGTTIAAGGYLIIWADDQAAQAGLHANFKLSSQGEEVLLSSPAGDLLDKVIYTGQTQEISYARNPDGTGSFVWQTPTYNSTNNTGR